MSLSRMWISSVIFAATCGLNTALFMKVYDIKRAKNNENYEIYAVDGSTPSTIQPKLIRIQVSV